MCLPTHPTRFFLYRLNSPGSLSLSSYEMLQSLNHFNSPLFNSALPVSLFCWGAQNWAQHSRCGITSTEQHPRPDGDTPSGVVQDSICLLCGKGTLLVQASLAVHQDSQGLFVQSCFPVSFLQPVSADAWVCSSLGAALGTYLC